MKTISRIQLISLMLIVFSSLCVAQSGTWTELKPKNSPLGRSDFGMSSLTDGKVIIFGGVDSNNNVTNETWIYDYDSNDWNRIYCKNTPKARFRMELAQIIDKKVLLYGGDDENFELLNDTWLFDLDSMNWIQMFPQKTIVNPDFTSGREDYVLSSFEKNKVLLYGGFGLDPYSDTWIYDLDSNKWKFYDSFEVPGDLQGSQMCNLSDGKVILFGGKLPTVGNSDKTWIFDIKSKPLEYWTEIKSLIHPSRNSSLGMERINENWILLWGTFEHNFKYINETWLYNISDSNWIIIKSDLQPRMRTSHKIAKIKNNFVLLFGDSPSPLRNDTWLFSFEPTDVYDDNNLETIISPNPASDYIEISLDSPSIKRGLGDALSLSKWGVSVEIFNIFGEKTTPSNLSGLPPLLAKEGMMKIDISNLPAGVYFIKIGDKFEKFVKI